MKRFAVNMLTIIIVLAIGCLFLFSGTGCSNNESHGHGGGIAYHASHPASQQGQADATFERLANQHQELMDSANATIANTNWDELTYNYQDPRTEEQKELGEMLWNQIYADGHLDDSERELWIAYCDEVAPDRL